MHRGLHVTFPLMISVCRQNVNAATNKYNYAISDLIKIRSAVLTLLQTDRQVAKKLPVPSTLKIAICTNNLQSDHLSEEPKYREVVTRAARINIFILCYRLVWHRPVWYNCTDVSEEPAGAVVSI